MSKIMYKDKPYMSTTDLPDMTLTEARAGTEEESRVISPKTLFEFAVNRLTGNIDLDTSAASGDDYDLTQALTSLGWLSDVVTSGVLGSKKLIRKILTCFAVEDISDEITMASGWQSMHRTAYKLGKMVFFSIEGYSQSAVVGGTQYTIANIASGYRPSKSIPFTGHATDSTFTPQAVVNGNVWTGGTITGRASNANGRYFFISGFYKIA